MADALQDALARLDALAAKWIAFADDVERQADAGVMLAATADALGACHAQLSADLAAIRAAHNLPASAASSADPPADAPPCSAGLTAGASSDAPAL